MKSGSAKKIIHSFQFDPQVWLDVLTMTDEDAGKRFKEMIIRLARNEAPEGTNEADMIARVNEYIAKQREKIMKRWHPESVEPTAPQVPQPPIQRRPVPQIPIRQGKRIEPPTKEDLYELCEAEKLPLDFAREWYDYMEKKGWNEISKTWQGACRAFCKLKLKTAQTTTKKDK